MFEILHRSSGIVARAVLAHTPTGENSIELRSDLIGPIGFIEFGFEMPGQVMTVEEIYSEGNPHAMPALPVSGIGSLLMYIASTMARDEGMRSMRLRPSAHSLGFFHRIGMHPGRRSSPWVMPGNEAWREEPSFVDGHLNPLWRSGFERIHYLTRYPTLMLADISTVLAVLGDQIAARWLWISRNEPLAGG